MLINTPPNDPKPYVIRSNEGAHSLESPTSEGGNYARIPLSEIDPNETLNPTTVVFKIANKVFASKAEWYGPALGISDSTIKKIAAKSSNPEKKLKELVITRMKCVATNFYRIQGKSNVLFQNDKAREEQLYRTICKVENKRKYLEKKLKTHQAVYMRKSSPHEFSVIMDKSKRVFINLKSIIGEGGCKIVKDVIDGLGLSFARLKPKKISHQDSKYWYKEVEVYRLLSEALNKGEDLEGLLTPITVSDYTKKIKGLTGSASVARTQVMVRKLKECLLDSINERRIDKKEVMKICFQITKGLNTFHTVFGLCHRDLKPDNILLDSDGNAYIMDYGYARVPKSLIDTDLVGSHGYYPPEIELRRLNPKTRVYPIDSAAWDAWTLGVVLFMVKNGNGPTFFFSQFKNEPADFFKKLREFNTEIEPPNNSLDNIIYWLLRENPLERCTVNEAYDKLKTLYEAPF